MASSDDPNHRLQQLFDQLLVDRYGHLPTSHSSPSPSKILRPVGSTPVAKLFTPKLDVIENNKSLIITAELPGAKKEDISLDLCQGILSLSGKTNAPAEHSSGYVRLSERSFGSFSRTLNVSSSVTPHQIKASLNDGILQIVLHKSLPNQDPQKISIG